jgi:hypothetical protein
VLAEPNRQAKSDEEPARNLQAVLHHGLHLEQPAGIRAAEMVEEPLAVLMKSERSNQ